MRPDVIPVTDRTPCGSALCLACGLCCTGVLHRLVTVDPEHVELVSALGLTVETVDDHEFAFRQPCPLYQGDRCSAYPHHPPSCQGYRCALLRKYEGGEVTLEDGTAIARAAKELLAGGGEPGADGYSEEGLRLEVAKRWDREHGLQGTDAQRQAGAELALRAVALDVLLEKHFRLPDNEGDTAATRPQPPAPTGAEI